MSSGIKEEEQGVIQIGLERVDFSFKTAVTEEV